jgi:hypothetical protein
MNPIIEVAVKKAPIDGVGRQNADEGERNRRHDDGRRDERAEPAHDEHIDQDQDHREGESKVTKDFHRDMPLPIPLHGEAVGTFRHGRALVLLHPEAIGQLARPPAVGNIFNHVCDEDQCFPSTEPSYSTTPVL